MNVNEYCPGSSAPNVHTQLLECEKFSRGDSGDHDNCDIPVTISNKSTTLWHCRSIKNKIALICDCIINDKLDILVLTETWLCDNARDSAILDYYLPNYQFFHKPRAQRGGGVGVILRKGYDTHELVSNQYSSFEHLDLAISSGSTHLHLPSVYRPPPSKKNKLTVAKFMNDFSALLETIIISSGKLIITGDFNFHMDDVPLNQDASLFMDLLDYYGLVQHVSSSTHARGHLLDLIITKPDTFVGSHIDTSVSFTLPSDHALVTCSIAMPRPKPVRIQQHSLENCQAEISPATDTTFQIGYYAEGNKKFSISSEIQLAEAFSLVKNGKITLWVDPNKDVPRSNSSVQDDSGDGEEEGSYESCLSRLRGKRDLPEFKLRCWARMVVNGTHNSEDTPPNVPFFTGISKASKPSKTVTLVHNRRTTLNERCGYVVASSSSSRTSLRSLLDKHAPQRLRFITLRPHAPWFNDELRSAKQAERRFERKWKTSGLEIDKQIFKEQFDDYTSLINEAKKNYHINKLSSCGQHSLFREVDKLTYGRKPAVLPSSVCSKELAAAFSTYFKNKVIKLAKSCSTDASVELSVKLTVKSCSVLGPLLFSLYTSEIEDLFIAYSMDAMIYADDTQFYIALKDTNRSESLQRLQHCIDDIRSWSTLNKLVLNDGKTEIIHIISSFARQAPTLPLAICCGSSTIIPRPEAQTLGLTIDNNLLLKLH
ncbi:hypothetical protein P5673_006515, partial [Acropora cervicornis]